VAPKLHLSYPELKIWILGKKILLDVFFSPIFGFLKMGEMKEGVIMA
jgi:hypothetical protein